MQKAGYGPDKHLAVKVSTRNIPVYRDPAVILIDQLKSIYIDGELDVVETANWFPKVARKDYALGLNLTGNCGRRSRPVVLRELLLRLGAQLHQLLQQGDREAVRRAIPGNRRRQAQEAGLGDRQASCRRTSRGRSSSTAAPAPAGSPTSRASPSWSTAPTTAIATRTSGWTSKVRHEAIQRVNGEQPGVCLYRAAPRIDARDPVRDLGHHLRAAAHRARQHRRHPVRRRRLCRPGRQGQSGARTRARSADRHAISALDRRAPARRPRLFLCLREAGARRDPAADSDHGAARRAGAAVLGLDRDSPGRHQRGQAGHAARLFPARRQPERAVAARLLARPV